MDLWKSLSGMIDVVLIAAEPAYAMTQIHNLCIPVYNVRCEDDDITIRFRIHRQDYKRLKCFSKKKGYTLQLSKRQGVYWLGKQMLHRPVLCAGLVLFLLIALYLPTRVFFFEVEGNVTIPTRMLLEKCEQCGITFGTSRRQLRSEKMKNALLETVPQLQWAGINTYGCRAVISVRERSDTELQEEDYSISSIVATRDGIISQCTATKGNLLCKPGQAVKAGQILISGYTDCGISIQATRAEGEIFATTERDLSVVFPAQWQKKEENRVVLKKYAVIIGKKRINFYKGSGILPTSCDKMYEESYVTLPGGFRLPILLVTEVWTYRQESQAVIGQPQTSHFARNYLAEQMVSGTVISAKETMHKLSGAYLLKGKYFCLEMIGRIQKEEIIKPDE